MKEKIVEKTVEQAEKTTVQPTSIKERFEFVLTFNDFIVCKRYFKIIGFKYESESSLELKTTLDKCVKMITDNLKSKSNVYNAYTAPRIFKNVEEMEDYIKRNNNSLGQYALDTNKWYTPTCNLEVPSMIYTIEEKMAFIWDGEQVKPYEGSFYANDYVNMDENEEPSVIKFTFYDNGRDYMQHEEEREVYSCVIDGSLYPRFIRNNIDLSSSKNKYKTPEGYMSSPFEAIMIDILNAGSNDIISPIIREICKFCSNNGDEYTYTTEATYGDKTYNLDINNENYKNDKKLENSLKKKTTAYYSYNVKNWGV